MNLWLLRVTCHAAPLEILAAEPHSFVSLSQRDAGLCSIHDEVLGPDD